ncbi:hypothetical protein JTE90_008520 [Oedothorax gibbosus]|uniref:Mif2/CENP-C cupin domain-containing protein n=1 Tax=Oedothorax gibbosus TaxID=931172 RepID=A0AAV6VJL9_9ARAC|nr:hypothetical protein JTE90_008520 [Oedothorax gibbosus]
MEHSSAFLIYGPKQTNDNYAYLTYNSLTCESMVVTRRPQRLRSSVPGKNTRIPAPIHRSSVKKKVNHSSQKRASASKNAKLQCVNTVISAKSPDGLLLTKGKSRGTQPNNNNKSAVEEKGSTVSPRIARNSTKRQSVLSATFTKHKSPKEEVSQKVGGITSSIAEASSSQMSVQKETNKPSNVVPQKSLRKRQVSPNKPLPTQSPKKEVNEDMNKNKAQPSNIMVAKRGSLRYSQLNSPSPPDPIKSKRKAAVETQNKFKSEVKLRSASTKIVKAKSVMLRNSKRKFRRTSISIVCTRTVTGYLNTRSTVNSSSLADSVSLENLPENKISSSLKPKSLFPDVTKCKEVSKNLSHFQNHISPSQSKNVAIKDTQIKDGSDFVRSDKVMPKRKVPESRVTDVDDAALVSANQPKKHDVVSSSKGLRSKVTAKDSEVEADASKDKKSKIKEPNAASNKGLKPSIGEKDKPRPGESNSPENEAGMPTVTKTKNIIKAISSTSISEKNKNFVGYSKSSNDEEDQLVPSPKLKKSKFTNPNVVSGKGLFEAKAKKVDGVSESAREKADKLVPSLKKSKCTNPNAVSNKGLSEAKAKKVAGVSESAKEEADESVHSPKVTKSKKGAKQDDVPSSQGVRCSTRRRFPPCERWHGQRPLFRFKKGLGFVFSGISPGWKKDESAGLAILKRMQKLKMKKKEISKPVVKTPVIDQNTKAEVDVTLHCPFDTVEWTAVAQGDKIPFQLAKTFVSDDITFGFLDINPLERKGSQYSPEDNIHFHVVEGQLKVMIHHTEFLFNRYDSFIVPCAATYSIENVGSSKALLSFSTFRTPFFPHQEEMND